MWAFLSKFYHLLPFSKVWIVVLAGVVGIVGGLAVLNYALKTQIKNINQELTQTRLDLANKEIQRSLTLANLGECNAKIDLQNEKIKQILLDNEKLKSIQPEIKKEVEVRYKTIKVPTKDSKCEAKLGYYENLFKELGR